MHCLQGIMDACRADVQAVKDRDAACDKFLHCILYYKGFQAVQCHRIAHWLWKHERQVPGLHSTAKGDHVRRQAAP